MISDSKASRRRCLAMSDNGEAISYLKKEPSEG